jgi:arabinose-5-phosphate isomerase
MNVFKLEEMATEASRVLRAEAQALLDAADRLDVHDSTSRDGYNTALYYIRQSLNLGGKVVVTGVGKSGKIGEKMVATLQSTGSCAVFLHPIEALHGDLGLIQSNDCVLALSYSGNTDELLQLIPSLRHRNVPIIGLGGNPTSKLAKECNAWIDGYVKSEVSSELPAPTSSTTLALAMGDALALSLAQLEKFQKDDFALNHPGGSLGRRLLLKVKDVMVRSNQVATVEATAPLDVVITEMTKKPKARGVLVLEPMTPPATPPLTGEDMMNGGSLERALLEPKHLSDQCKILGVITTGDIRRVLAFRERIFEIHARDVMTAQPVTCQSDQLASEVLDLIRSNDTERNLSILPVVDKCNRWRGVLTRKDLESVL